jgi:hypothetical protein
LQCLDQFLRAAAALQQGFFVAGETVKIGCLALQVSKPGSEDVEDILIASGIVVYLVAQGRTQVERQDGVQARFDAGGFVDGAFLAIFLQVNWSGVRLPTKLF